MISPLFEFKLLNLDLDQIYTSIFRGIQFLCPQPERSAKGAS